MNQKSDVSAELLKRVPREELARVWTSATHAELRERFGYSAVSLGRLARFYGLPHRPLGKGRRPNRKPLPEGATAEEIIAEFNCGVNAAELGRRYGVGRKVVLRWIGKQGTAARKAAQSADEKFEAMMLGVE